MYTDLRLKIRDFFKRNKSRITIILIIWAVIIIINLILKSIKEPKIPSTSYTPHIAIMDSSEVPVKQQEQIEQLIEEYIGYCNNKEYENAYNLLSNECKSALYPNLEEFKKYVDNVFNEKKTYSIQNYSNVDDTYIYEVSIFEDILATGLTGKKEFSEYVEKIVIKNDNGNLSLSIREYIGDVENYQVYEDEYLKVEVQGFEQSYETQTYKVKLTNRTEYKIVLANKTEKNEIMLELNNENRNMQNISDNGIMLLPYASKEIEMEFVKFFDEEDEPISIIFNAVRVLKSYSGLESKRQEELDNAVKLYSLKIGL